MLEPATIGSGDNPPSPAQIYASENRDDAWATQTEAEIRRRFQTIRGAKLDAADCRATRCSITVSGSEAEVGTTIADLEGDRGLHGYAENVLLTVPEKRPNGSIVLRAIASFRR